jgi:hypothetical protein
MTTQRRLASPYRARQTFQRRSRINAEEGVFLMSNKDLSCRRIDVNIKGVLHGIVAALPVFRSQGFW